MISRFGWDGIGVLGCSVVVVAATAIRGVHGLEPWIGLVLAVDAAYLGFVGWRRA